MSSPLISLQITSWFRVSLRVVFPIFLLIGLAWAIIGIYVWIPWPLFGGLLSLIFLLLSALLFWRWRKERRKHVILILPVLAGVGGFSILSPGNSRDWEPPTRRAADADITGDMVTLHNFRNFDYRSTTDFTERWETRTFHLSRLQHLDFYMVYWGSPHICHTMVTFDFGPEGRVCASIEARRESHEAYSPLAGLYRRYEVIYVLGDERDLVRLRTQIEEGNQVYLFRIKATPDIVRALFLDYLKSVNQLRTQPAWYNTFTSNCSTLIRQHVQHVYESIPWDWRFIFNGHLDTRLYEENCLDRALPLVELKRRSFINETAQAAGNRPDFSERIRAGLPGFAP
jgi:hypothetical protein